jgi:hypothetical protein
MATTSVPEGRIFEGLTPEMTALLEENSDATGVMAVMSHEGDTPFKWNKNDPVEVENARRTFEFFTKEKKFFAFKEKRMGGQGDQIREFDPNAEKIIFVPQSVGG